MLILIGVLFYVPTARSAFWSAIRSILDLFGVSGSLASEGWDLFQFWR